MDLDHPPRGYSRSECNNIFKAIALIYKELFPVSKVHRIMVQCMIELKTTSISNFQK